MDIQIVITPGGHLRVEQATENSLPVSDVTQRMLQDAFAKSNAHGLLRLGSQGVMEELPATLAYWRNCAAVLPSRVSIG